MFKVGCSTYELAKVISYLQMLCFYDFTVVTELKVCDKCLSVSRVPKEFILYYMRAHRRCLLIIIILLLFSAYELYVKWTELTPLPIVVENVVFL